MWTARRRTANRRKYSEKSHQFKHDAIFSLKQRSQRDSMGRLTPSVLSTPSGAKHWLLHKSFFHFTTMHLNEIVWLHQKVTEHSVNFIPTGESFAIVIYGANGRTLEVDAGRRSGQKISSFADALQTRIPWVAFGYSSELKNLYKKSRRDFAETVRARRIEYLQKKADSAAAS